MNELEWMEQGNSLTPPPHGYLYYKNPPTEKRLSESQKKKLKQKGMMMRNKLMMRNTSQSRKRIHQTPNHLNQSQKKKKMKE